MSSIVYVTLYSPGVSIFTFESILIFFDISPEVGLSRIQKNKDREVNRLDLEKLDFHNRVRDGYYKLVEKNKENFAIIDAEKSIDEVFNETKDIIMSFIK